MLTPDSSDLALQQHRLAAKQHRVLACVLCQQRKIRCDRTFPCSNCTKNNARCVPATQTRPRRKRFPERELLDRLRHYETLLRENKVKFEPLHKQDDGEGDSALNGGKEGYGADSDHEDEDTSLVSPGRSIKSETVTEARSIWQAISQESPSDQGKGTPIANAIESNVKNAWAQLMDGDNLLLGMHRSPVDLATFHPDPVTAFKMWQLYIDHVDPLLKITHVPTLQPRFIAAIGNVGAVKPPLEALMFGVYSLAVLSLSPTDCAEQLGMSREELLTKYQFGCEQALMNAGYLRSADLQCLTAMTMHLMSLRPGTNPRSIAAMLGLAIRIAECQGIHRESTLVKCTVFEAEMRRRLWWCLMLYDTRMGEKADHKDPSLAPTWDCRQPINCNDSDLWPDMKEPPISRSRSTEALYSVIRAEIADHIRNSEWFLDFSNPRLKPLAKELPDGGSIDVLEQRIQRDYLRYCDMNNPIHFFTVGATKAHLIRSRLFEHFARSLNNSGPQTEDQRDHGISIALDYLMNDQELVGSPLCRGYLWYLQSYFPFPAYMHLIQDLQRRPLGRLADRVWSVMHTNYVARFDAYFKNFQGDHSKTLTPLFIMFSRTVNLAWETLQKASEDPGSLATPGIILEIERRKMEALAAGFNPGQPFQCQSAHSPVPSSSVSTDTQSQNGNSMPFVVQGTFDSFMMNTERMPYPSFVSPDTFTYDPSQFDWFLQH